MKNSTKVWGLIGAAAIFAPVGLSAPALADGGAGIGNSESTSSAYASEVSAMMNKTSMEHDGTTLARLLAWHEVMLEANALDHTEASGVAGDQQGPVRNSRAFAIIQIAVFDAVNAFDQRFRPFSRGMRRAPPGASRDAAIAQAAYTALSAMYPRQQERLDAMFDSDLAMIQGSVSSINAGRAVGRASANAIVNARRTDGAGPAGTPAAVTFGSGGGMTGSGPLNIFGEPVNGNMGVDEDGNFIGFTAAPRWSPDPFPALDTANLPEDEQIGLRNVALGANWGGVRPFVLRRGDQFRIPAYPAPGSPRFRAAYNDVFLEGSDPLVVPGSTNDAHKQFIGNYWGYDGAPLLGTPPRLYAQIAVEIANSQGLKDVNEYARLLALVHTTMGDSGVAAWDSKYFHNYWRPSTGIPFGDQDGDPQTVADPNWRPFGASVVNLTLPERFTPPFPAYPSGHATFGAATFQSLSSVFGNTVRFTFVSDEYNDRRYVDPRNAGKSVDGIRPLVPVRYDTLLEAQEENGRSRVFNGVHWEPDDTEGQNLGTAIVRFTLTQAFQRR